MENIFNFAITCLIVIGSLYFALKLFLKKYNPDNKKVGLFGILQGMNNKEIVSISCSIISYVFMAFLMVSFVDIDLYIIIIILFLTIVSGLLVKNKKIFIDILLSIVSLGGLKLVYLIHDYIINEYMSIWLLLILVFVMIFLFLYFTYTLLKNLKLVVYANKYVRKGGKDEDKKRS